MARLPLIAALAATFLLAGTVMASTQTITGRASFHDKLTLTVTTVRDGDVTATATFTPKGTVYNIHIDAAADVYLYCHEFLDNRVQHLSGQQTLTCTIPNAPAGTYKAAFWSSSGQTTATLSVTAETE